MAESVNSANCATPVIRRHCPSPARYNIADEKRGLIYAARVKMDRASMDIDGKTVNLAPGMAVTVEIKTGMRRVAEYFLSPLLQYKHESLRER